MRVSTLMSIGLYVSRSAAELSFGFGSKRDAKGIYLDDVNSHLTNTTIANMTTTNGTNGGTAANAKRQAPKPFTQLCNAWGVEYLLNNDGSVSNNLNLWTNCPGFPGPDVVSLMALDHSLIAQTDAIVPANPSNTAPVWFSDVCKGCHLTGPNTAVMQCNCNTNANKPLTVDLAMWISAATGVPCFVDLETCGKPI